MKAIVTRDDFPEIKQGTGAGDMTRLVMAREKVYWEGHPVAAVAATSESIAKQALKLIEVEYEVLAHVIDPVEAMQPGAPILHDYLRTKGVEGAGRGKADERRRALRIVGRRCGEGVRGSRRRRRASHSTPSRCIRAISSRNPASPSYSEDGQVELWCCTQAPWLYRDRLTAILKIDSSKIRIQQSELGGGFGGKTTFYAEPVAIVLSRKAKCPVKMTLTRGEVLRATGPVSATHSRIKMGCKKDGTIVAADAELIFQTGPYTGSMFTNAPQAMLTRYDIKNVKTVSYEVVSNRPKVSSFRAPCVPQVVFAAEGVVNEMAKKIGMDPIEFRLKNAIAEGHKTIYGETFTRIGLIETLQAAKACDHYKSPVPDGQGRGIACGFWFNRGGETSRIDEPRARRHGDDHSRHRRRGRLAHVDVDDGGGGVRHSRRPRAVGSGRHAFARLQPRHGRQPHDVLERHDRGRLGAQDHRRTLPPRGQDVERSGRRGRLRGRPLPSGELERRRIPAALDEGHRRQDDLHDGRHLGSFRDERHRRGSGICRAHRRRRGRQGDRPRVDQALHDRRKTPARRSVRCRSKDRCRVPPCKASAGR